MAEKHYTRQYNLLERIWYKVDKNTRGTPHFCRDRRCGATIKLTRDEANALDYELDVSLSELRKLVADEEEGVL